MQIKKTHRKSSRNSLMKMYQVLTSSSSTTCKQTKWMSLCYQRKSITFPSSTNCRKESSMSQCSQGKRKVNRWGLITSERYRRSKWIHQSFLKNSTGCHSLETWKRGLTTNLCYLITKKKVASTEFLSLESSKSRESTTQSFLRRSNRGRMKDWWRKSRSKAIV